MTQRQIMADLGEQLIISELKTADKFTNTSVTYTDTQTINSRSVDMGTYNGSTSKLVFDGRDIRVDKKIISLWIKTPAVKGTFPIYNFLDSTDSGMILRGLPGLTDQEYRFGIYSDGVLVDEVWFQLNVNTVYGLVLFLDYSAGLESSDTMKLYYSGSASTDNSTSTWTPTFLRSDSSIGESASIQIGNFSDSIYDFCMYDYQSDSRLRNYTQLEIVNAILSNDWGVSPSYLFSDEYTYLQDLAVKGNAEPIYKVELKRRANTGLTDYDSSFTDITDKILEIGDINIGVEDDEQLFDSIKIDNVSLQVDNRLGYFNEVADSKSFWNGAYSLDSSYIKISLGLREKDANDIPTDYLEVIFKGIIEEEDIDYKDGAVAEILLLSYAKLLDKKYMHEIDTGASRNYSATSFIKEIFDSFESDYGDVIGFINKGTSLKRDFVVQRSESLDDTQFEFIEDAIKKSASIFMITNNDISINFLDNNTYISNKKTLTLDGDTQALWRFTETATPITISYDETLNNNDLAPVVLAPVQFNTPSLFDKQTFKWYINNSRIDLQRGALAGVPNNADVCYEIVINFETMGFKETGSTRPNGYPFIKYHQNTGNLPHQFGIGINNKRGLNLWYGAKNSNLASPTEADKPLEINGIFTENQWYYIAVNLDYTNEIIEVWVNGEQRIKTGAEFGSATYDTFQIATQTNGGPCSFYLDSMRISDVIRTEAQIKQVNADIFGVSYEFGGNIGDFIDYGKDKNIHNIEEYKSGIKEVKNYIITTRSNSEIYSINCDLINRAGASFTISKDYSTSTTFTQGVNFTNIEGLVEKINEYVDTYDMTAEILDDGTFDVILDTSSKQIGLFTITAQNWDVLSVGMTNEIRVGFLGATVYAGTSQFTPKNDLKNIASSDEDSINLHGKKIYKIDNDKLSILNNNEVKAILDEELAKRKDIKFNIVYTARYLENLFKVGEKAKLFYKANLKLDKIIGEGGNYNGSPYISSGVSNNKPGGYIPWRDRETEKIVWITGITISPSSKTITWRGREV